MITRKGKSFGPFSRFRVDVMEETTFVQAVAFDAEANGDGPARVLCKTTPFPIPPGISPKARGALRRMAETACRALVEASPEWQDAQRLGCD